MIDIIGLDADDTLWHNEIHYSNTKRAFADMLLEFQDCASIESMLERTEMRNIHIYGFGIKSYTLSLIETAIEITNGNLEAAHIHQILSLSKNMLDADVHLLDRVEDTLADLSSKYNLMLISKGDTFEQEKKIQRTGLYDYFKYIEIVGAKTPQIYASLLDKYHIDATRFIMVGNALKSDVLPVLEIGGMAVYIHYEETWAHENEVSIPYENHRYYEIERIDQLPQLVDSIINSGTGR